MDWGLLGFFSPENLKILVRTTWGIIWALRYPLLLLIGIDLIGVFIASRFGNSNFYDYDEDDDFDD